MIICLDWPELVTICDSNILEVLGRGGYQEGTYRNMFFFNGSSAKTMDNQTQFHTFHNCKNTLKNFVKGRPNLTKSFKQTNKDHQHWSKANQTTVLPVSTQRCFDVDTT